MTSSAPTSSTRFRSPLRDRRQRFDAGAEFVWRKRVRWGDDPGRLFTAPRDLVDKSAVGRGKLRRLWDAEVIELAAWRPASSRADAAEGEGVDAGGGGSQGRALATSSQSGG